MTPLASYNATALRSPLMSSHSGNRSAADAQSTLSNRLGERLGLQPGALAAKAGDYSPDKVAQRVVDSVEQRLRSEKAAGADSATLQGLLEQARAGIEKGFADARKILDDMGVLQGRIAEDIDSTYQKIQGGLADLSKQLMPPPAASTAQLSAAAYSERFTAQAETFEMAVTTRDGDQLRISVVQASADWSQKSAAYSNDGTTQVAVSRSQSGSIQIAGWQVEVQGELDDEERAALEKLFGQVQTLSDKFYAGDLAGAFDRAMSLSMDGEQLASMSLRLTQTSIRQATDAYSTVAQEGAGQASSAVNSALMDYAQALLDALKTTEQIVSKEEAAPSLLDLLKGGFSLDDRFSSQALSKAGQLNQCLLDGLAKHN